MHRLCFNSPPCLHVCYVHSGYAGGDAAVSYETSAIFLEGDTFDLCGGHATGDGIYHYHNTAGCLQEQVRAHAHARPAVYRGGVYSIGEMYWISCMAVVV